WCSFVSLQFVMTYALESGLSQQAIGAEVHGLDLSDLADKVLAVLPPVLALSVREPGAHTELLSLELHHDGTEASGVFALAFFRTDHTQVEGQHRLELDDLPGHAGAASPGTLGVPQDEPVVSAPGLQLVAPALPGFVAGGAWGKVGPGDLDVCVGGVVAAAQKTGQAVHVVFSAASVLPFTPRQQVEHPDAQVHVLPLLPEQPADLRERLLRVPGFTQHHDAAVLHDQVGEY